MLTPQDIQNKELTKAVFGGYDMAVVDDFLEEVSVDFAALYKENAILKSKLKVLVEKVEVQTLHVREQIVTEIRFDADAEHVPPVGDDIIQERKPKTENILKKTHGVILKNIND